VGCSIIRFGDGAHSVIPRRFFIANWMGEEANFGTLHLGRVINIGVGPTVKVDSNNQGQRLGRFIAGGERIRFILNAQHSMTSSSTFNFACLGPGFRDGHVGQYGDMVIDNDSGSTTRRCSLAAATSPVAASSARALVTPEFKTEPYGIYLGTPARLARFRFPEKIREKLLDLAWLEQPMAWIKIQMAAFTVDITKDEGYACEVMDELKASLRPPVRAAA
jgi:hypothetical protein